MIYSDTPKARDPISSTQSPIQDNFSAFNTTLKVNHVGIAMVGDPPEPDTGKHNKMTLVLRSDDDLKKFATIPSNLIGIFCRADRWVKSNNQNNLYIQKGTVLKSYTTQTANWTLLPSTIHLYYGKDFFEGPHTIGAVHKKHVAMVKTPGFTEIYSILVVAKAQFAVFNVGASYDAPTLTGFDVYLKLGPAYDTKSVYLEFYYIVIGV